GNSFTAEGMEEYIQLIVRCVEVSSERRFHRTRSIPSAVKEDSTVLVLVNVSSERRFHSSGTCECFSTAGFLKE
ncbi:hypothetical protein Tco_0334486, partial [Tanacetum coccineum]